MILLLDLHFSARQVITPDPLAFQGQRPFPGSLEDGKCEVAVFAAGFACDFPVKNDRRFIDGSTHDAVLPVTEHHAA